MNTEPWDDSTYDTQQRDLQRIMTTPMQSNPSNWRDNPTTDWERYWVREDLDSVDGADFTFGEVVWKAAQEELLRQR